MSKPDPTPAPGTCFKFMVASAEEAAALIRERLGPDARVLSVRTVEAPGLSKLWAAPRLEVVAQIEPAPEAEAPEPEAEEPAETPAAPGSAARPEPVAVITPRRAAMRSGEDLPVLLRRSGISEVVLGRLQEAPFWRELVSKPLHRALGDIGTHLQAENQARLRGGSLTRAAFLGTPGVGRTTALCKWLGREAFRNGRAGHVVMAEFDTPHAPGVLPVFCEAMGVPVSRFPASTEPAGAEHFVYLDLPGLSLRDLRANEPIARFLDEQQIEERVLVLNAAYDHSALRAAYALGRDLGATHLVFTHLDELPHWGRLWDYLLDGALEPLFLGTGPSLTGDCETDVFEALVRRTLAAAVPEPAEEAPAAARILP